MSQPAFSAASGALHGADLLAIDWRASMLRSSLKTAPVEAQPAAQDLPAASAELKPAGKASTLG
jgi:hypothetical protein